MVPYKWRNNAPAEREDSRNLLVGVYIGSIVCYPKILFVKRGFLPGLTGESSNVQTEKLYLIDFDEGSVRTLLILLDFFVAYFSLYRKWAVYKHRPPSGN